MSDKKETESNVVFFPASWRSRLCSVSDVESFTRFFPLKRSGCEEFEFHTETDRALCIADDIEFTKIFGFSLNARGRAAVRNIMRIYDLSIEDVRRFRSVGYLRWNGHEIHLEACKWSILYGLFCCSIFAFTSVLLFILFSLAVGPEHSSSIVPFALFSLSTALFAWSYLMFLKPFCELRRVRTTARLRQ